MVVARDWPGALVALLCLHLPVAGAFFPHRLHQYFTPTHDNLTPLESTLAFCRMGGYHTDAFVILSGSVDFLRRTLPLLEGSGRVIVTLDVERQGASRSFLLKSIKDGYDLCRVFRLRPLVVGDAAAGGASNAQHFFGLGDDLASTVAPVVEPRLQRTVHNILDGGVKGRFPSFLQASVPPLHDPAWGVFWHDGIVRPEGLFPCHSPNAKVYCPLYRLKGHWLIRSPP